MTSQVRRNGPYAPLGATYYMDDDVIQAGPEAEVLFTRILAFCSSVPSDGYVTDAQIQRIAVGLSRLPKRLKALADVGLLEKGDGGYVVRSWLKWNKSAAEQEKVKTKDRERKAAPKQDGVQADSERNPDGDGTDSKPRARAGAGDTQHVTTQHSVEGRDSVPPREDVEELCSTLADLMVARGCRPPSVTDKWRDSARLLLDRDGVRLVDAISVLRWSQANDFWRANILSLPKFREKYDQLRQQAERDVRGTVTDLRAADHWIAATGGDVA